MPKRCCSSIMTRPSAFHNTLFCISAWVPTRIGISPFATHLRSCAREMCKVADEGFKVLARKDLGGRHVGNLLAREHCRIGRNCRNGGLTRAHVTFQNAHHGARPREVSEDCRNSARLRGGKRKGEA